MATMQKIVSNLWFDNQAEEAAKFYTSVFEDSKIKRITYFGKAGKWLIEVGIYFYKNFEINLTL